MVDLGSSFSCMTIAARASAMAFEGMAVSFFAICCLSLVVAVASHYARTLRPFSAPAASSGHGNDHFNHALLGQKVEWNGFG
jgi:predicted exporter